MRRAEEIRQTEIVLDGGGDHAGELPSSPLGAEVEAPENDDAIRWCQCCGRGGARPRLMRVSPFWVESLCRSCWWMYWRTLGGSAPRFVEQSEPPRSPALLGE